MTKHTRKLFSDEIKLEASPMILEEIEARELKKKRS